MNQLHFGFRSQGYHYLKTSIAFFQLDGLTNFNNENFIILNENEPRKKSSLKNFIGQFKGDLFDCQSLNKRIQKQTHLFENHFPNSFLQVLSFHFFIKILYFKILSLNKDQMFQIFKSYEKQNLLKFIITDLIYLKNFFLW